MDASPDAVQATVLRIRAERFASADTVFLCGSVSRGEATPTSDLDLVVLFPRVDAAWRESFTFESWPGEGFCPDLATAAYYFSQLDRPSGIGGLTHMVLDGIALPNETPLARQLRTQAKTNYDTGPTAWAAADVDYSRYTISGLMDDLRGASTSADTNAIATVLYALLAQHVFRRANRWSAHGKTVLPRLRHVDPGLAARYEAAFANAFTAGRIAPLLELCGEILAADGYLFNGYRVVSDATWRTPIPAESAGVAVTAVPIGARR